MMLNIIITPNMNILSTWSGMTMMNSNFKSFISHYRTLCNKPPMTNPVVSKGIDERECIIRFDDANVVISTLATPYYGDMESEANWFDQVVTSAIPSNIMSFIKHWECLFNRKFNIAGVVVWYHSNNYIDIRVYDYNRRLYNIVFLIHGHDIVFNTVCYLVRDTI